MSVNEHPYVSFLEQVRRPARYLGGEYGQLRKSWSAVGLRLALAFPDLYELGMSHLGLKILYEIVNRHEEFLAERVFAPDVDLERELRARRLPLVSLESWQPLSRFEVVGFSLQYELTYTNLLNMLELGGIPLRAAERDLDAPLVVAGGPCALHPEPLAPFIDLFLIGDGEEALPMLLARILELRRARVPREEQLLALAELPGCYVPAWYPTVAGPRGSLVVGPPVRPQLPSRIRKAVVAELDRHPFPTGSPVASIETTFDRFSIELTRGCNQGCRFCQAGMTYRPVRERSAEQVLATVRGALLEAGHDEVSLTALSTADYTDLTRLVLQLGPELTGAKAALSVSSLRAYGVPEELLKEIGKVRTTGLTFAPEAGTQRLRDVINKNVSDDDLEQSAAQAFRLGWTKLKLYFMIGLPTETPEDLEGILATIARIQAIGRRIRGRHVEVTGSVSSFVPRPHTPFQWAPMLPLDELERRQSDLLREARRRRLTLRLHERNASRLEGIMARGDRRLAQVIETAWRAGARFDGWEDRLDPAAWAQAWAAAGFDPGEFLAEGQPGERLPWDHLDPGVDPEFLAQEWERARRGVSTPPCAIAAPAVLRGARPLPRTAREALKPICHQCGLQCELEQVRTAWRELGAAPPDPEPAGSSPGPTGEVPPAGGRGGQGGRHKGARPPTPAFEQGEPVRYRLHYAKLDRAVFLGHLDVVRDLPRIFRRAGIAAHYSLGYHPKPVMAFGPALRLGISSFGEWVEVQLQECPAPEVLLERFAAVSTPGIRFLRAVRLPTGAPRLSRVIRWIEHGVVIGAAERRALAERFGLEEQGRLAIPSELPVEVRQRDQPVTARWGELAGGARFEAWVTPLELWSSLRLPDWTGGGHLLRLLFLAQSDRAVRPEQLLAALGLTPEQIRMQARLACWGGMAEALVDPLSLLTPLAAVSPELAASEDDPADPHPV